VVDLVAKSPHSGLLPLSAGQLTLTEAAPAFVSSIQARQGKSSALARALQASHGLTLPEVGKVTAAADHRLLWFGTDQYLLIGAAPAAPSLSEFAALTDQGDAWAVMHLVGAGAAEVLARHCPLDLRTERFGIGQTARAPLADMPAIITPIAQGFEIMVLQSLSRTAVHHLHQAMLSLAAQASLI